MTQLLPPDHDTESDSRDDEGVRMGFLDHLEELRWSLLKPLAVFLCAFFAAMVFISDVKDLLMYPLFSSVSEEERQAFRGLATRNLTGVYTAMLHIGLMIGVTVASPFFLYYLARFLAPGLTAREKRLLVPACVGALALFLLGCLFSFFLLLPKAISVTIWMNAMMGFQIIWTPESYFSFTTWIVIGMGLSFQFPLAILVLTYLDIVTVAKLRSLRRVMIIAFLIVAALLTPPDPVTLFIMAAPMYALYEASIWLAAALVRKRERAARNA